MKVWIITMPGKNNPAFTAILIMLQQAPSCVFKLKTTPLELFCLSLIAHFLLDFYRYSVS